MGRITTQELDEELLSSLGATGDSTMLNGKPAEYYDQSEHVKDTTVHVNPTILDKIENMYNSEEIDLLKQSAVNEANIYTDNKLGELVDATPGLYEALLQVKTLLDENPDTLTAVMAAIGLKTDEADFEAHTTATNPHNTTKEDIGLDLVDNTPDSEKVVKTATKLAETMTINFTGDVTGHANFDGSKAVDCKLTYGGAGNVDTVAGVYTQVEIDDKGRVINAFNPQTLEEYGIIDAATAAQGKKADSAVQSIWVGSERALREDGTVFLPAYPTDAETLQGKSAKDFAPSTPVDLKEKGLMTPEMYLRLYASPSELDQISVYKEDMDSNGVYRTVRYCSVEYGEDNLPLERLYKISRLEGETPYYSTRVETLYVNGKEITMKYRLAYDESGNVVSEVAESYGIND